MQRIIPLLLLVSLTSAEFNGEFPATTSLSVSADADTNGNLYKISTTIRVTPAATDQCYAQVLIVPSAGSSVGVELGTIDLRTGNTGNVAELTEDTLAVTDQYITFNQENSQAVQPTWYEETTTNGEDPAMTVTWGDDGKGSMISTAPADNLWKIHVYVSNCDNVRNPSPVVMTGDFSDVYFPHYVPLIASSDQTNWVMKRFTDSSDVLDQFNGVLTIYTDTDEETFYGINKYFWSATSLCDFSTEKDDGGCANSAVNLPTGQDLSGAVGEWTVSLTNENLVNNIIYIHAQNTGGDISVSRKLYLTDLRANTAFDDEANCIVHQTMTELQNYAAEKKIGTTDGVLKFSYGDTMSFKVAPVIPAGGSATYTWTITDDSSNKRVISGVTGDKFTAPADDSYMTGSINCEVEISESGANAWTMAALPSPVYDQSGNDLSLTGITVEWYNTGAKEEPQDPNWAVLSSVTFTDTDTRENYIAGDLVITTTDDGRNTADTRWPEYYVCYLSLQDQCTWTVTDADVNTAIGTCGSGYGFDQTNDVRIAVIPNKDFRVFGAITYALTATEVPNAEGFIQCFAYESSGTGVQSANSIAAVLIDVGAGSDSIQQPASLKFSDMDSDNRKIRGVVELTLGSTAAADNSICTDWDVYRHTSQTVKTSELDALRAGGRVSSFEQPGGGWTNDQVLTMAIHAASVDYVDPASFNFASASALDLDAGERHYKYLVALCRIAEVDSTATAANTFASTHIGVEIIDRNDEYFFFNKLNTETGACPGTVCPNGDLTSNVSYWVYATETGDHKTGIFWVTASMANSLYEYETSDEISSYLLDNTALTDLSSTFTYDVSVGTSDSKSCSFAEAHTTAWPHNAPGEDWIMKEDLGTKTIFYTAADFDELVACGCTSTGLAVTCPLQLEVTSATRTDSVGSVRDNTHPQLTISASLVVTYNDETYATMTGITVENVLTLDEIDASITVDSELTLYDEGFFAARTNHVFQSSSDFFHVEQKLKGGNALSLMVDLERMWFARSASRSSAVEYYVPSSSHFANTPAENPFINADKPAQRGRYRFNLRAPMIMNCQPCVMHCVSTISAPSKKKSDGPTGDRAGSSAVVFLSADGVKFDDAANTASNAVVGTVAALVAWRM